MVSSRNHLSTVVSADGAAVLDTQSGTISTLNATGALVWGALGRGASEDEIVAELVRLTGGSVGSIASDVHHFLIALVEQKLLSRDRKV